jgi:uncharacterized membrane protein
MDDPSIQSRLAELEARVAKLEAEASAVRTPPPRPAVPPPTRMAPWPEANEQAPSSRTPPRPIAAPRDYERLLGLAVLGRVGMAAMLLAAAYFGQLGWTHLGPVARIAAIYCLGAILLVLGQWLRPRVAVLYIALMWGGSVGACYMAGLFAYLRYELLSSPLALLLLLASTALGQWLAHILRLEALATVALAGAFAAPIWVAAGTGSLTAMVALAIALHAWSAWMERRWGWLWARAVGWLGAMHLVGFHYSTQHAALGWHDVVHLETLLLTLIAPELHDRWRDRGIAAWRWLVVASLATLTQAFLLLETGRNASCRHFGVATAFLALAAGIAYERRSAGSGTAFARLGSVLLPIGALVLVSHEFADTASGDAARWGYAAALLVVVALLQSLRGPARAVDLGGSMAAVIALSFALLDGNLDHDLAARIGLFAVTPAILLLFGQALLAPTLALLCGAAALGMGWWPEGGFTGGQPGWAALALSGAGGFAVLGITRAAGRRDQVLGWTAALTLGVLTLVWFVAAVSATPAGPSGLTPFWNMRCGAVAALLATTLLAYQKTGRPQDAIRSVLGATAIALAYAGGLLELLDAIADWPRGWHAVATDLYTLGYAGALLSAGFATQRTTLRWVGLAGFVAIVVKVACFDLANLETPLRMLASGALGAVLLAVAWAYARRRR